MDLLWRTPLATLQLRHHLGTSVERPGLGGIRHDGRQGAVEVGEDGRRGRTGQQRGQGRAQVGGKAVRPDPMAPRHALGDQLTVDVVVPAEGLARSGPTTTSNSAVLMELTGADVV